MPWQLNEKTGVYTMMTITGFSHNSGDQTMSVQIEYGSLINGRWTTAVIPFRSTSILISGSEYLELVTAAKPQDGELTYQAVKRGLYEFLAAKGYIGTGIVV